MAFAATRRLDWGDSGPGWEWITSLRKGLMVLSWRHSGFSVHTSVTVPPDDRDGLERLARYLLRPPVSLDRLRVDKDAAFLTYAARKRSSGGTGDEVARDSLDFLARVVMHIPEPRPRESP